MLFSAREKHMTNAMKEMVCFVVRPQSKDGYAALFQESALIQGRHRFSREAGVPGVWRHGWIYDAGSDVEPTIGDKSKRSPRAWAPNP